MATQAKSKIITVLREKWPEYLLEVIVIIFSISISFALDEWKDSRKDRELEQSYLKSLSNDIHSDIEELKEIISATKIVIANADRLLEKQADMEAQKFGAAIFHITKRPNFISKDATFSDLKSSGNMQIIRDLGLKNLLFSYYQHYESGRAVEISERETMNTIFAPFLLKRISLQGLASSSNKSIGQPNISALMTDVEFINLVSVRKLNRQELLNSYQESLKTCKEVELLLERQI